MILQIENTNICNATCGFCPHKIMKRQKGIMENSVFEKILVDSKKYQIDGVAITGIGEPLLDSNIVEKVKIVKKVLNIPVTIYTNGTNLKKYLKDLLKNGLNSLMISLNAANSEKRKAIMGIDYFDELDEIIKNWNGRCDLLVCTIPDMGYMERFDSEEMKKNYGNKVYFHYVSNWGGQYNFDLKFSPTNTCPRPFEMIHVNWDGSFVLCCLDYEGKIQFGKSIQEMINNETWKYYRKMLQENKRSELELCKNCTTV